MDRYGILYGSPLRKSIILTELNEYAKENNVPIIKAETARLLQLLVRLTKPNRIFEGGTAIGYSSILIAETCKANCFIDTVEIRDDWGMLAKENIKKAGYSSIINVIIADVKDVLKNINCKYDMIFMDAAKGQYIELLPDCLRILKQGGILISDNVLFKGMVEDDGKVVKRKKTIVTRLRKYISELCENDKLETIIIPIGDGIAISYKLV